MKKVPESAFEKIGKEFSNLLKNYPSNLEEIEEYLSVSLNEISPEDALLVISNIWKMKHPADPIPKEFTGLIEARKNKPGPDIVVNISKRDKVVGLIWNGKEGKIVHVQPVKKGQQRTVLLRFAGSIEKPVLIDGKTKGIKIVIGEEVFVNTVQNIVTMMRQRFFLSNGICQKLHEVLNAYIETYSGNDTETYKTSPVSVSNGEIVVDYPLKRNVREILELLKDYEKTASNPEAYRAMLAWALIAPLHYYLKVESASNLKCPLLMFTGKTGGGKSSLSNIFIGIGFELPKEKWYYTFGRVEKVFMLSIHLSESNIPCLIDDIAVPWIIKNKENFKSYVHSGIFIDRGKSDQGHNEYRGMRSFVMTLNEDYAVDTDLALATRIAAYAFTETEKKRLDLDAFNRLLQALPKGFMYELIASAFEDISFRKVLRASESFANTKDWLNYGIDRINALHEKYNSPTFEKMNGAMNKTGASNATEIAEAFLAEWARMQNVEEKDMNGEPIRLSRYYGQLRSELDVDDLDGRAYIHFTPGAYRTLIKIRGFAMPYTSATDFINNIDNDSETKAENGGKMKSHRFPGSVSYPLQCFTISTPNREEIKKQITTL